MGQTLRKLREQRRAASAAAEAAGGETLALAPSHADAAEKSPASPADPQTKAAPPSDRGKSRPKR